MAQFKALYGRRCRSLIGWFEVKETKLLGPDLVQDFINKVQLIKEWLLVAQSRQKAYVNNHYRDLEVMVGGHVFIRVSPMKRVMRFTKKSKLSAQHICSFL